ncbi:unnamed protein product [Penicillium camemberti]|uniref:Str. FM013 n=1 Tax=Penicillium camemberti (strain FM 013) TaxID=1429867 RepID=A0A0G4PMR7_PENC3|nr:unnamed protein product [Penicillium camemberti]
MTERQLELGSGPCFAVFKYLCHSATDKKAFIRIYFQIPIPGTEYQPPELRRQQGAPPREHLELQALKDLRERHCDMVPTLLAYKEGNQCSDGLVPDGYITHLVWDMVPGKPLDTGQFWRPELALLREAVRTKFRDVWEELKRHGWQPGLPLLQKIIYESTGDMCMIRNMLTSFRHIAGFRGPDRFDPGEKFSDMTFVLWRLTRPPRKSGWEKDPTKWAW